jgi:S1-C subfamily serine protease
MHDVVVGGLAELGGLKKGDVVMSVNGQPTPSTAALKSALEQSRKNKSRHVVFFVRRGVHTLFCEAEPD